MGNFIPAFLVITFFLETYLLHGQGFLKRTFGNLINDTGDISKPRFLAYPTIAYSPETNLELGINSIFVFYANGDTLNRIGEINALSFLTVRNQYGLWLEHAIYGDKDKIFFLGRIRFQSFPLLYFGIGRAAQKEYLARVDANQIWIKERVLGKVKKNLFIGLELDYQRISQVYFVRNANVENIDLPLGYRGSTNFGIGAGIVYDNRHNVLNVRNGFFSEFGFLNYNKTYSDFGFQNFFSDTRIFRPLGKRNVIAAQLIGQFNIGNIPFNQLALMGGENMMRGYYTGRFRDKNQIAAQTEIRFLPLPLGFSKRIGATVFGSVATVSPNIKDFTNQKLVAAGGAGLRFLVFPKKDIYTRLDYAFTREGGGLYIFFGEAF
jgi:hypothetical protein